MAIMDWFHTSRGQRCGLRYGHGRGRGEGYLQPILSRPLFDLRIVIADGDQMAHFVTHTLSLEGGGGGVQTGELAVRTGVRVDTGYEAVGAYFVP